MSSLESSCCCCGCGGGGGGGGGSGSGSTAAFFFPGAAGTFVGHPTGVF